MIPRKAEKLVSRALARQAAVALIGPRQSGKTTLAFMLAGSMNALYLDLEDPADRDKLSDPSLFLGQYEDRLVVLDEIHRVPELFQHLRVIIDKGRRKGRGKGRFLLLGSAAIDLLRQSGESLAGRIAYVEMGPFTLAEVAGDEDSPSRLWVRGGFPDSYLAGNEDDSFALRKDFIRTYLERDVPMFGPRIPAETLGRLWTMLAHGQGTLLNTSRLAVNLSVSAQTATRYIDLLADLLLVRRLPPHHANLDKRLVKSPKVYVRDSGLLHALLGVQNLDGLFGHPVVGMSWEGFVIENLLAAAPDRTRATFYRTTAGAEIDLLLELPSGRLWAVEVKLGSSPKCERGFYNALADICPDRAFVVYSGTTRCPVSEQVEAIGLEGLVTELSRES